MRKRGFTLIELLVVIAIIGVLAAILLPNIMGALEKASQTTDISNLKGLAGIYISGQTDKKPTPKAKGHRFWLAMFVGDSQGVSGGLKIDDVYASPSQAGNLLCPKDTQALSKDEISQAFEDALNNGTQGWDQLTGDDTLYTSYAGPRSRRSFSDKKSSGIIGCDGSRDGLGFFLDGFATVNSSQGTEFKTYEALAEKFPNDWTGEEDEPNWESKLLSSVYNLDSAPS